MNEIWKDIPGYEGYYQASSHGRIRSIDRVVFSLGNGYGSRMVRLRGKMKACRTVAGYHKTTLIRDGICLTHSVHRLVCAAFMGNPSTNMQVNHIDGVKTNNSLANLEWCTGSENLKHAIRTGLYTTPRTNKFTDGEALEIRKILDSDLFSCAAVGRVYGVSGSTMENIRNRKTYFHLDP